jgi:hypothetical protein
VSILNLPALFFSEWSWATWVVLSRFDGELKYLSLNWVCRSIFSRRRSQAGGYGLVVLNLLLGGPHFKWTSDTCNHVAAQFVELSVLVGG